jgi:hypothetical protein
MLGCVQSLSPLFSVAQYQDVVHGSLDSFCSHKITVIQLITRSLRRFYTDLQRSIPVGYAGSTPKNHRGIIPVLPGHHICAPSNVIN